MPESKYDTRVGPLLTGDRPLPQSIDAERAVLSCLLQDPGNCLAVACAMLKAPEFFYIPAHRKVFECIRELQTADVITVADRLARQGALEAVGGEAFLNELLNTVPTTANVERYAACVLESHVLREMIRTCSDVVGKCLEPQDDVPGLVDSIQQRVMDISLLKSDNPAKSMRDLVVGAINHLNQLHKKEDEVMGIPSGYRDLDRLITGLKPGDLIVLAARPSIGKTTFAMNVARNVAVDAKVPVGFFSLEMGASQVALRLLCSEARINLRDVRDGKLTTAQWQQDIMHAGQTLRNAPFFIDDTPQISSMELRQKARRLRQDHGIGFIVVDYLQLMRPTGGNRNSSREQEVARMSGDLKALAKDLEVPVMVLAQLNRQAEQSGGRPKLSHLRESGAIEQDADLVALLHREREVETGDEGEEGQQARRSEPKGIETELIIAKHRNGEIGVVPLTFLGAYTRFENHSRYNDDEVPV